MRFLITSGLLCATVATASAGPILQSQGNVAFGDFWLGVTTYTYPGPPGYAGGWFDLNQQESWSALNPPHTWTPANRVIGSTYVVPIANLQVGFDAPSVPSWNVLYASVQFQGRFQFSIPNGASDPIYFSGEMNAGWGNGLAHANVLLNNPDTGAIHDTFVIGDTRYSVWLRFGYPPGVDPTGGYPTPGTTPSGTPGSVADVGEFYALISPSPNTPEPGTILLAGFGFGAVMVVRLRRSRQVS